MKDRSSGLSNGFALSAHTRRVRFMEKMAKSLLWLAAGLTMGTLLVIIGYIVYRGLVSDLRIQYNVLPSGSEVITAGDAADSGIMVIVNGKIRIDDIQISEVADLFSGEIDNWGAISEQDIDVRVFGHAAGSAVRDIFESLAFVNQAAYADQAVFADQDEQVIESVANTAGAIGYISAAGRDKLQDGKAKAVEIRHLSIAVSPTVLEVRDGTRLHYLTGEQVRNIFSGQFTNWSEVGGTALPIKVAVFPQDSRIHSEFAEIALAPGYALAAQTVLVNTASELAEFLTQNPGAAGFVYHNDALRHELSLVNIERRELELNLSPAFILEEPRRAGRVGGISSIILNTFFMIAITLILAGPVGVAAAIYLTEYARKNLLFAIIRFGTETLAGVPSIVFGLFGFILFVMYLNIGVGLLSGTLTITFMILPTIIRASEEAIKSVPVSLREGSLALGATKWQTITRVVVPVAIPGILTGLILGIGRAVGETAALLFTMGSDYRLARDFLSSARVMSVHLYILVREGISFERAFATGTILIIIILLISYTTNKLIGRMIRLRG